jgi:hypothetical protein
MRVLPEQMPVLATECFLEPWSAEETHRALSALEKNRQAGLKKAKLSLDSKDFWSQEVD